MQQKYAKGGLVFSLAVILAGAAVIWMLYSWQGSASPEYRQLIQRMVSLGGIAALVLMAVTAVTRVEEPKRKRPSTTPRA